MSIQLRTSRVSVRRLLAIALGAVTTGAAFFLAPASASAHDQVTGWSPVPDSTVTEELTEVSVTFSQPPLAVAGARIDLDVLDPSGTSVASGEVRLDGATLSRSIATTTHGVYTVQYQSVSVDGHSNPGEFTFTYEGPVASAQNPQAGTSVPIPGGPLTAQPSVTAPASAIAGPTQTTAPSASAADESPAAQTGVIVGAIIGALVVIGAIAAVIIAVRRRNRALPSGDGQARD